MADILKHLDLNSADGTQLNLDALYQVVPSAFTEVRDDKTGEISRKVNFEVLRRLLGDHATDGDGEMYQFTWVGKNAARAEAAKPTDKTLRPVVEDSVDWDNTKNIYVEGDNLEVLKLLQRSYMGKVKMIYIDPPYNTGNDFVYHDDFAHTAAEEDFEAGNVDELGYRFRKNTDTNGKFHSDWCSMIYTRLLVARSLLAEDGVIFISIDDNEVRNLRNICDEVFGEHNFVAQLVWERAYSPKNDAKYISNSHDYILMFAKQIEDFTIGRLERTEEANARYSNPDNDPRGVWKPSDMSVKTYNAACDYPITTPSGKIVEPPAGYSLVCPYPGHYPLQPETGIKLHDSDHAFLYVLCHSYITYTAIIISYTGRDIYCKALIYTINIYAAKITSGMHRRCIDDILIQIGFTYKIIKR